MDLAAWSAKLVDSSGTVQAKSCGTGPGACVGRARFIWTGGQTLRVGKAAILALSRVAAVAPLLLSAPASAASLLTGTVAISNNYPTPADVDSPVSTAATTSPVCVYNYCFSFTDNRITFSSGYNVTFTAVSPPDGNYFVLDFTGVAAIGGVTLDRSSAWAPVSIAFSGDSIVLNVQGVGPVSVGTSSVYDVTFAGSGAPEPGTWAMMLLGVTGLGSAMRSARRRLKPQAG